MFEDYIHNQYRSNFWCSQICWKDPFQSFCCYVKSEFSMYIWWLISYIPADYSFCGAWNSEEGLLYMGLNFPLIYGVGEKILDFF